MTSTSLAWVPTRDLNNSPWNVAPVANTATTPVVVCSAAGFTAGSMPTNGTSGSTSRRWWSAAAEAELHAITINSTPADTR